MNKVKIPKFVADYIESIKQYPVRTFTISKWKRVNIFLRDCKNEDSNNNYNYPQLKDWVYRHENKRMYIVIKAIIDGY